MSIEWRIYYRGGSTFCSADGGLADAPGTGVEFVVFRDEQCGRGHLSGCGYYAHVDGEWLPLDREDLYYHLFIAKTIERGHVLAGVVTTTAEYVAIRKKMLADPDFPPKSAWRRDERPDVQPETFERPKRAGTWTAPTTDRK